MSQGFEGEFRIPKIRLPKIAGAARWLVTAVIILILAVSSFYTIDPEEIGGVVIGTDTGEVWRVSEQGEWTEVARGLPAVLSLAVAG